jgi:glycerol-3-phosphate acyltransferase PlsY
VTRTVLALMAAYVIGSIPWAYLAGRLLKGIDLRQHGSGNLGATNVYRTLGAAAAVVVLTLDAGKGVASVLLVPRAFGLVPTLATQAACGVAAILGHVRPVFLLWRGGGKGVATAAGVFGALAPAPLLVAAAVFLAVLVATRLMSLASLVGATVLPVALAAVRGVADPLFWVALAVGLFVFWTHRANLGRLRRGEEPRFGEKTAV